VRKRAKIVHEPAFSGTVSSESSVAGNDSESDFDAPKMVKGTGKPTNLKGNAGKKGLFLDSLSATTFVY